MAKRKVRQVILERTQKEIASPQLPHERDQSTLDQQQAPTKVIKQAQDDIESGQQDTDLHGTPGLDKPTK